MIFSAQQDVQPGNKIKNSAKMLTYNEIAMHVVEHVTSGFNVARFNMCERGEISRDVFAGEVKSYIRNAYRTRNRCRQYMSCFRDLSGAIIL